MARSPSLPPRLSRDDIEQLLARADEASFSAREELERANLAVQSSGLSVLDGDWYHPHASGESGAMPLMDFQQEAALAVQARRHYNPLRGTLSAFPLVLSTTAGEDAASVWLCICGRAPLL